MKVEMTKLAENSAEIKRDVNALRSAQKALDDRITQIEARQICNEEQYQELKANFSELERKGAPSSQVNDIVESLEAKIDVLEQQARVCNLEICNVPERRGENLLNLLEKIGSIINFPICRGDIVAVHRVPQMVAANGRPKNIVVRFSSVPFRDNVMAAFRKNKGLMSDKLSITGTPCTIYMNEHLTLKKKLLFRECRRVAQKYNYKYVWVKHATILARRTDASAVVAIRHPNDIQKLGSESRGEVVTTPL